MGRPIKKRYFVKQGAADASVAVKYKGVAVALTSNGTHYSQGTTVSVSAPTEGLADGVQATFALTINSPTGSPAGGITGINATNVGAGYSTATITIVKPATVTSTVNSGVTATNTFTVSTTAGISIGMLISGAITGINGYVTAINGNIITSTVNNNGTWNNSSNLTFSDNGSGAVITASLTAQEDDTGNIACTAFIPGGSATTAAILKQEGSHRYLVENDQGRAICKLTTSTAAAASLVAGQMNIIAKDANGSTYVVTKLTSRKARVIRQTVNGSFVFANGTEVRWVAGWGNASGTVSTQAGACVGIQTY